MISLSSIKCKQKRSSPSRETPMTPARFETAFANLILAASSSWALHKTGVQPSASAVTFTIFLIHAVVGVIRFGNPQYGDALRSSYENTAFLCIAIALPCFVTQFGTMYGIPKEYMMPLIILSTAVTAWHYISRLCSKMRNNGGEARWVSSKRVRLLVFISLSLIFGISYQKQNYYGFAAAVAFCHSFFITGPTGTVFNLPAVDLFLYQLTFFNIFAVKALLD